MKDTLDPKMIIKHLLKLLCHKWFVFIEACKLGVPWLGFIHDASKFQLCELLPYSRYFYGTGSPNDRKHGVDFDVAWNHHQKCNKHHWQYWVLINDRSDPQISALPMPERYILEMVADWRGAGRAYGNSDSIGWYEDTKDKQIMHPDTRKRAEELLKEK